MAQLINPLLDSKTFWQAFSTLIKPQSGGRHFPPWLWGWVKHRFWNLPYRFRWDILQSNQEMIRHEKGTGKTFLRALGTYLSIERSRVKKVFVEKKLSIVKVGFQRMFVHTFAPRIYGNRPVSKGSKCLSSFNGFSGCIPDGAIVSSRN